MADAGDNVLDKAESLARRILERLGSNVDSKLASKDQSTLNPHHIGDLASRIERLIESELKADDHGVRRIAPNRFKVLFTYEETSKLSPQYIEAVGKELTATVFEYINNRRYTTRGRIEVVAERDLFAKTTLVKAAFDGDLEKPSEESPISMSRNTACRRISLSSAAGRSYQIDLNTEEAPACIGRSAGNAVRLDDASVSRLHSSLSLRGDGKVVIADVGSANGTYVNDQLLGQDEARPLQPGDIVRVGDFNLTVSEIS
jgi:septum formation topological specificity factor MinE